MGADRWGQRSVTTKPLLVRLSHAIDAFALASDRDYPLAVIALFQRRAYFDREAHTYARLSAHAAITLVGIVDPTPDLPEGPTYLTLDEHDPLAREWSVTALSPRSGAHLTAIDLESSTPPPAPWKPRAPVLGQLVVPPRRRLRRTRPPAHHAGPASTRSRRPAPR